MTRHFKLQHCVYREPHHSASSMEALSMNYVANIVGHTVVANQYRLVPIPLIDAHPPYYEVFFEGQRFQGDGFFSDEEEHVTSMILTKLHQKVLHTVSRMRGH